MLFSKARLFIQSLKKQAFLTSTTVLGVYVFTCFQHVIKEEEVKSYWSTCVFEVQDVSLAYLPSCVIVVFGYTDLWGREKRGTL